MPGEDSSVEDSKKHWKHLFSEIVATEICCGCSACVVACPQDVIEMDDFDPVMIDTTLDVDNCIHGENGCTICAKACLRLDPKYDVIENLMFGRRRKHPSEPWGIAKEMWLARAADASVISKAQDGGVVSALLAWMLSESEIEGVCVSRPSDSKPWFDEPHLATSAEELLGAAGSRYTYCSTPLALREAAKRKMKRVAMVGVSCEVTAIREMEAEGLRRWTRMVKFVAGLMCNETFAYEPFIFEVVQGRYKIPLDRIKKINVKGDVVVTLDDDSDVIIPLDECKQYANEWCHSCPDFAAEHADISFGGLGMTGWTMCLIRTEYGMEIWNRAVSAGILQTRIADEEPRALKVLSNLSKKQRRRVEPLQSHASGRWSSKKVLERVRAEYLASEHGGAES